jgi:uncharacterized protein with von Willebrand factor type A (vWA) domain
MVYTGENDPVLKNTLSALSTKLSTRSKASRHEARFDLRTLPPKAGSGGGDKPLRGHSSCQDGDPKNFRTSIPGVFFILGQLRAI